GPRTGVRKFFRPSIMVAINDPSGFAHARIRRKKIAICNQPLVVMALSRTLKLLRLQKRVQQIHAERQRNQSRNKVVHISSLEPLARLDHHPGHDKKGDYQQAVSDVRHFEPLSLFRAAGPRPARPQWKQGQPCGQRGAAMRPDVRSGFSTGVCPRREAPPSQGPMYWPIPPRSPAPDGPHLPPGAPTQTGTAGFSKNRYVPEAGLDRADTEPPAPSPAARWH